MIVLNGKVSNLTVLNEKVVSSIVLNEKAAGADIWIIVISK